jgi:hypothetical protein
MITRKQAEDIRWVAAEVLHLAVILQSHGLGSLANKLNAVEQELRYAPRSRAAAPEGENVSGKIVFLESYRRCSVNPSTPEA